MHQRKWKQVLTMKQIMTTKFTVKEMKYSNISSYYFYAYTYIKYFNNKYIFFQLVLNMKYKKLYNFIVHRLGHMNIYRYLDTI